MISITVITCTYNASSVLARTLDSVKKQDYARIEHFIIDGLSKDNTMDIVREYESQVSSSNPNISLNIISERDNGLYDAMNKGLLKAQGKYLVFLNAGDVFPESGTLSAVASAVGNDEKLPGVLYGHTDVVDDKGNFICHRRLAPSETLSWRDFKNGMLVCHQAFYALTSIARTLPYNNKYKFSADVDWCIRVMKQSESEGRRIAPVGKVIVNFLDGGMTTANHRASLLERFKVMCNHYGFFQTFIQHLWFVVRAVIK